MNLLNQLMAIVRNLGQLGTTKLIALGAVGLVTIGLVLAGSIYLKPSGLRDALCRARKGRSQPISVALAEAGIEFQTGLTRHR